MRHNRVYLLAAAAVILLAACAALPQKPIPTGQPTPQPTLTLTPRPAAPAEETEIAQVIQDFGRQLHMVSVLSPTAAQDIQAQYSAYVAPELITQWAGNPSQAPGTKTSSPWPDRIEIISVEQKAPDEYVVGGFIIEVTSAEAVNGGAADKIPVRLTVTKIDGKWLISQWRPGEAQN